MEPPNCAQVENKICTANSMGYFIAAAKDCLCLNTTTTNCELGCSMPYGVIHSFSSRCARRNTFPVLCKSVNIFWLRNIFIVHIFAGN